MHWLALEATIDADTRNYKKMNYNLIKKQTSSSKPFLIPTESFEIRLMKQNDECYIFSTMKW